MQSLLFNRYQMLIVYFICRIVIRICHMLCRHENPFLRSCHVASLFCKLHTLHFACADVLARYSGVAVTGSNRLCSSENYVSTDKVQYWRLPRQSWWRRISLHVNQTGSLRYSEISWCNGNVRPSPIHYFAFCKDRRIPCSWYKQLLTWVDSSNRYLPLTPGKVVLQ